jgi:hypothetical protein
MKTAILGTSIGYGVNDITPFILSLRKFYSGKLVLVVDNITDELDSFFKKYNVDTHLILLTNKLRPSEIFHIRHKEYLKIIDNLNVDYVFITDVRDVLFQGNPFSHNISTDLEFFSEPKEIKNCDYNSKKILKAFGEKEFLKLQDNKIICAGTTIGTKLGIRLYLEQMILILDDYKHRTNTTAEDQAVHNFLIYNNYFKNFKIYDTGFGPIATLHHLREGIFNNLGQVINNDNSLPSVVHQWDRLSTNHKEKLLKNLL